MPKKSDGVQVVKSASGDIMMVLPISKRLAASLAKREVAIVVAGIDELSSVKKCLARYDGFRLKPDLVINPVAEIVGR